MISSSTPPIRLGTRGSALALWQAEWVRDLLSRECPMRDVEMITVKTLGDRIQDKKIAELGRTAVFTAELDRALQDGDIDIAVHSQKDVETTLPAGLMIGAVLPRGPVEDVLVARVPLASLPPSARVGTGSLRRAAQLRLLRPDIHVEGIRGNVPTRLLKLDSGEFDAICMARAGLVRLGFAHRILEVFPASRFLPAVGQGAVCVQCRASDESMRRILAGLNHGVTAFCVQVERGLLRELGAGCNVPVGVHTFHEGDTIHVAAAVFTEDPKIFTRIERQYSAARDATEIGIAAARELLANGARLP